MLSLGDQSMLSFYISPFTFPISLIVLIPDLLVHLFPFCVCTPDVDDRNFAVRMVQCDFTVQEFIVESDPCGV